MAIYLIRGDLVNMEVDAIVANANVNLKMVEGVGRAIFHKAGDLELAEALKKYGHCNVGQAVMTDSFEITNTKAIIHAVGPNYINGKHGEEKNLRLCYRSVLKFVKDNNFKSVALPIISSDFNYPLLDAYSIGVDELKNFLKENPNVDFYYVLFKQKFAIFDDDKKTSINKYLNANFESKPYLPKTKNNNVALVSKLNKLQEENEIDDNELTYLANLESKFLKVLKNDQTFIPPKGSLISIGIALKLNFNSINEFLSLVGYELTNRSLSDLIVKYYLNSGVYDVLKINDCLFHYNLELLSKKVL